MTTSTEQLHRELDALYRAGEEARMQRRRELLSLRSTLTPLSKSLDEVASSSQLSIYQIQIRRAFGVSHEPAPYVIKIQAQLCHALHSHEIQLKQLHIFKRRNKQLTKFLQKEVEDLTLESGERQQELVRQVENAKATLEEQSTKMESTSLAQEEEIRRLMDKLDIVDMNLMSPQTRARSVSESLQTMMEKISFEDLKNVDAHTVLEVTKTPTCLSRSKLWIDLKKQEDVKVSGSLGDLPLCSGSLRRSRHIGSSSSRHTARGGNKNNSSSNRNNILGGSSHHAKNTSMDLSRRGLMKSLGIGTSIRNLVSHSSLDEEDEFGGDNDHDDDIDGSPQKTSPRGVVSDVDDLCMRTPTKDDEQGSTLLGNTDIGQSLLELVNSDDSMLSPTSKDIKKLSEEVFAL